MKIKEVSETFQVSMSTLRYYEKMGLFDDVKRVHGIREYEDKDITRLSLIMSLRSMNFKINEICQYIHLTHECVSQDSCIHFLKKKRYQLLSDIHEKQKCLDHLDCFIYQIQKEGDMYEK